MQESSKIKRICIIMPSKLPVPNIKGGAIETLITLLIDQNEIQKKVHFIVICAWAEGIDEIVSRYEYTEFHFFRIRTGFWKKSVNFINYVIARLTGSIDYFKTPMHYDIEAIIRNIEADAVVVEHGVFRNFEFLQKYFNRNQMYLHIHGADSRIDKKTKENYGHFIAISEYVKKKY